MKFDPWLFLFFGIIPLVISSIFLSIAYKDIKTNRKYSNITDGTIIKSDYSSLGQKVGTGGRYKVHIKFYDQENSAAYYLTSFFKNPPKDTIEIIYDKNNPSNAQVNGFFKIWGGVIIYGFLGSLFLGVAIIFGKASF